MTGNNSGENVVARWLFTHEQLNNTPSIRRGYTREKELAERQWAANFILRIGQELKLTQCCMNTAIVYMHRFYMFHSFQRFPKLDIATCSLFLAAKVEEVPKRLEHIINTAYIIQLKQRTTENLNAQTPPVEIIPKPNPQSKEYQEIAQRLVANENLLLQTLGFEMKFDHPHASIITCLQYYRVSKELTQAAYNIATLLLQMTTLTLLYKPSILTCVSIFVACKWSKWQLPPPIEGKDWWTYVDKSITLEDIERLVFEFLEIVKSGPERYKNHILKNNLTLPKDSSSESSGSCISSTSCSSSTSYGSGSGTVNSGSVIKKIKLEK